MNFITKCNEFVANREEAIKIKTDSLEAKKKTAEEKKKESERLKHVYLTTLKDSDEAAYKAAYKEYSQALNEVIMDQDLLNGLKDSNVKFQYTNTDIIEEVTEYLVSQSFDTDIVAFENKLKELKAIAKGADDKCEAIAKEIQKALKCIQHIELFEDDYFVIPEKIASIMNENIKAFIPVDLTADLGVEKRMVINPQLFPDGTIEARFINVKSIIK